MAEVLDEILHRPDFDRLIFKPVEPDPARGWIGVLSGVHAPEWHNWRGGGIVQFYSPYDLSPEEFQGRLEFGDEFV